MGLIMSMMEQAGTPMTDLQVIERIKQEKEEHEINKKLILIDKKLEQLGNLHQYHDTFLRESQEALRLEIFTIEERLVQASDKKVVDKKGADVNVNEQLKKLEADMREIFKVIGDYCEIFDNYKEANIELKSIFDASQVNDVVIDARKRRHDGSKQEINMADSKIPSGGKAGLVDYTV